MLDLVLARPPVQEDKQQFSVVYVFEAAKLRKTLSTNSTVFLTAHGSGNHASSLNKFLPGPNQPRACKWLLYAMVQCIRVHQNASGCFVVRSCDKLHPRAEQWLDNQDSDVCTVDVCFELTNARCFCQYFLRSMFDSDPDKIPREADTYLVQVELLESNEVRVTIDCC